MVIEYLRHILSSYSSPKNITTEERKLLQIVSSFQQELNDIEIAQRVKQLQNSKQIISVSDFGAGSKIIGGSNRKVGSIAKYASIQPKYGHLYAQILKKFNFNKCIELGTSFGIGTSYLAFNCSDVITIEGCPNTANIAKQTFNILKIQNVNQKVGEFSDVLTSLKISNSEPMLIYIDGNHRYEPTIKYFEFFKKILPKQSILIFDDIYWTKEMKKAWLAISQQPYFSIDLFKIGIVLLTERDEALSVKRRF